MWTKNEKLVIISLVSFSLLGISIPVYLGDYEEAISVMLVLFYPVMFYFTSHNISKKDHYGKGRFVLFISIYLMTPFLYSFDLAHVGTLFVVMIIVFVRGIVLLFVKRGNWKIIVTQIIYILIVITTFVLLAKPS